ncbi:MAG: hemagglutinin protein, partial [Flavobacteriales bacterium]|nr:hemagglutinin protein [Flavobacteriales bacterium]
WVVVELRDKNNNASVVTSRAALLQRDGDVVDLDGTSAVTMATGDDQYFVAVRHRNHLGSMTASAIALSSSTTSIDLTAPGTATYGTNARRNVSGTMTHWTGDVTFDDQVKYAGSGNDRDAVLTVIGGSVPTTVVTGYNSADVNMDAQVKYAGSLNDRDRILQTIGGSVPTAVKVEQIP